MQKTEFPPESPSWLKVRWALENQKFDFRTIDGIVREAGLTFDEVKRALEENNDKVRISYSRDRKGNLLYTLRTRPETVREVLSRVKTIVSSSSASST